MARNVIMTGLALGFLALFPGAVIFGLVKHQRFMNWVTPQIVEICDQFGATDYYTTGTHSDARFSWRCVRLSRQGEENLAIIEWRGGKLKTREIE
jgi:hypothetical protein